MPRASRQLSLIAPWFQVLEPHVSLQGNRGFTSHLPPATAHGLFICLLCWWERAGSCPPFTRKAPGDATDGEELGLGCNLD